MYFPTKKDEIILAIKEEVELQKMIKGYLEEKEIAKENQKAIKRIKIIIQILKKELKNEQKYRNEIFPDTKEPNGKKHIWLKPKHKNDF